MEIWLAVPAYNEEQIADMGRDYHNTLNDPSIPYAFGDEASARAFVQSIADERVEECKDDPEADEMEWPTSLTLEWDADGRTTIPYLAGWSTEDWIVTKARTA
jgi:hypothetical protein